MAKCLVNALNTLDDFSYKKKETLIAKKKNQEYETKGRPRRELGKLRYPTFVCCLHCSERYMGEGW